MLYAAFAAPRALQKAAKMRSKKYENFKKNLDGTSWVFLRNFEKKVGWKLRPSGLRKASLRGVSLFMVFDPARSAPLRGAADLIEDACGETPPPPYLCWRESLSGAVFAIKPWLSNVSKKIVGRSRDFGDLRDRQRDLRTQKWGPGAVPGAESDFRERGCFLVTFLRDVCTSFLMVLGYIFGMFFRVFL